MFLFNVCKQCTDVVLAHILSCCKTWVRVFVWWEQPADLWKMSCHLQSYTFTAMAGVCLLPWTAQTHQPELTKPILLENRGHFQQVISKSWGGRADLHHHHRHHWWWVADRHVAGGQAGASGWQLLRDSTCQCGLNGSQPKQRGCGREWLTPGIPTPVIFFLSSRLLLSVVGVSLDWGGLCMSSDGFANSPQSHFVAFIDNSNVLIIRDLLMDCESNRKEHIAVQNVTLALTCAHPPIIFLLF